jgi:hypothetical protein
VWRLLMLALYRSGRQADALAAYQRARAVLAGELGLEPGQELRDLERAVLRHEVPPPARNWQRHNLPAQLTSFLGREQELAVLGKLVGEARLVTLTGPGGAGKTRLAVEFAAGVVERFADGVWLAELAGISDPGLVAGQVMEALGVRQAGDVPVIEALRWRLRSAELLLVLDNCEHLLDACAQVAYCRVLMDEIFGRDNFVSCVIWQKIHARNNSAQHFSTVHDYIVVFAKDRSQLTLGRVSRTELSDSDFGNPDNDPRSDWRRSDLTASHQYSEGKYEVVGPHATPSSPACPC